jgi:putative Mg2+ transporter-C (MgtC) family protein
MGAWLQSVWQGLAQDFTDLSDVTRVVQLTVRLLVAAFLGGLLGYERERKGKSAGLRTHMLVSLGTALFVVIPMQAGMSVGDLSRVIQGLVTGIGFIGAGAILKGTEERSIKGLTTAASLWLAGALGMAAGLGRLASAMLGAALALIILAVLPRPEPERGEIGR